MEDFVWAALVRAVHLIDFSNSWSGGVYASPTFSPDLVVPVVRVVDVATRFGLPPDPIV